MKLPQKVIIVGGTHGNEWTGIQVVRHYQEHLKDKFKKLDIEFIFANPEAHKLNTRFKEEDLNRAFEFLHESRNSFEHLEAHKIKKQILEAPCVVLDLHTTTSNMGNTVILSHYNPLNLALCASLTQKFKDCRVIGAPDPNKKYLASQSEYGLILEIGPVANGVVEAKILENTLALVEHILEKIESKNLPLSGEVELYEETQDVHYPSNEKGELNTYIHSGFQGRDFQEIEGAYTPFKTFLGKEIQLKTEEKLYPIFINEAAYYPQKLAFTLCRKKKVSF